jgi:uncharacterized protein (TIGR04255 family)
MSEPNTPPSASIHFDRAPVVETRMTVQFRPLDGFHAGHFGLLWDECLGRENWNALPDADLEPHRREGFDTPFLIPAKELTQVNATPARMVLASVDSQQLFQFQPDQATMTFRRHADDCPTYEQVRAHFGAVMSGVAQFATKYGLGELLPDLWGLTYVNAIPAGELWQTVADWSNIFPSLFPATPPNYGGCVWSSFDGEWHLVIPPTFGRVHVKVMKSVANRTKGVVLLMVLTVRGEVGDGGATSWEEGLNQAHDTAVKLFYELSSPSARAHWKGAT